MNKLIYLDNAATSFPKPISVEKKVEQSIRFFCANPGRSSHKLSLRAAEEVYLCRKKIADLFGGFDERVVFTTNATVSINTALKSVLRRGDHVLISDIEHNAVLRPVAALAKRGLITYSIFKASENPSLLIQEISSKIKLQTSLVICCHHSNICNFTIPVSAVGDFCKKNGITFMVDASQSAGIIPTDIVNDRIDILCAPGHKGLCGIPGCGFCLFGDKFENASLLSTFTEGGNGIASENLYMPDFLPERLEAGTLPLPAITSLSAGIDFIRRTGPEKIHSKETYLCSVLRKKLSRNDNIKIFSEKDGSILLFSVKNRTSEDFASALDSEGICVRAGLHCAPLAHKKFGTPPDGAVRVSFSYFNTLADVEKFASTCDKLTCGCQNITPD